MVMATYEKYVAWVILLLGDGGGGIPIYFAAWLIVRFDMQTATNNTEPDKSGRRVQAMFDSIAPRYDVANTVLSFGIHHLWRRSLVGLLPRSEKLTALDLCTGTGDLLPLLKNRFGSAVGADFSAQMLEGARKKFGDEYKLVQADALNLPFEDSSFDLVTVAFGVRNFENLERGLIEIRRVLKPGGSILVLEFGQPFIPGFSTIFRIYSDKVMPWIGGMLTGNKAAYQYLPKTSANFPCGKKFAEILSRSGFESKVSRALCGGVAYVYRGDKREGEVFPPAI